MKPWVPLFRGEKDEAQRITDALNRAGFTAHCTQSLKPGRYECRIASRKATAAQLHLTELNQKGGYSAEGHQA